MLHQGLKVKKLSNFSSFKSIESEPCRISHPQASNATCAIHMLKNKSENHWGKLAHCTLQRDRTAAVELQTCPKY